MKAKIVVPVAVLTIFFCGIFSLKAQESSLFGAQGEPVLVIPKIDVGLQLGTSFTTGFGGSSLFTQSVAPHFTWNPARRFSLVVGSLFTTGQFSGYPGFMPVGFVPAADGGLMLPQRLFSTTVYAMGAYQANPRLTLYGASWVERNNFQPIQAQVNPQAFNLHPRGMMMGFDYRITENFSFGAQFNVSQGYNPLNPFYHPSQFQRVGFPQPAFGRNPNW